MNVDFASQLSAVRARPSMYGVRWEPRDVLAWLNGIAFLTGFPGYPFAQHVSRYFGVAEPASPDWSAELSRGLFPPGPSDPESLNQTQGNQFLDKLFELLIDYAESDPTSYVVEGAIVELA